MEGGGVDGGGEEVCVFMIRLLPNWTTVLEIGQILFVRLFLYSSQVAVKTPLVFPAEWFHWRERDRMA